jgi:asparagine synthase (glutamine-hydrolysing)
MCGIAGLIDARRALGQAALTGVARDMIAPLRHRGPDDEGIWASAAHGVALAHRRLSIIDVSASGHQPMASVDGRWVIAFNGEIYNYREIRADLERHGSRLEGESDTEVLIEAVARWGVQPALERAVGMFAVALWDDLEKVLYLARDRLGEKPVYFGWVDGTFLFASELKALKAFRGWRGDLDPQAVAQYFRYAYVPDPRSIYAGFEKLRPGRFVAIGAHAPAGSAPVEHEYWSAAAAAAAGAERPFRGSDAEATDRLDGLLRDTIRHQMISDVPLGAFLSGGVDSSLVVSIMAAIAPARVRAYTIGFTDARFDEAPRARAIAAHLGAEHHALYVTPTDGLNVIPTLPGVYDEPFADSSQIPTLLVAQLTRQHVTVALSGDGGDELFGGYSRHVRVPAIWARTRRLPSWLRHAVAGALDRVPDPAWRGVTALTRSARLERFVPAQVPERVHKLVDLLRARRGAECYASLSSVCVDPERIAPGDARSASLNPAAMIAPDALSDFTSCVQYLDLVTYLPGDILVKVDRACMAHSLESRAPLLDHRIVEFALSLPVSMRVRAGRGKWILRELLGRYVPPALTDHPKSGFSVPLGAWLRGDLRDWAEDLLSEHALLRSGMLDPAPVRATWRRHLSGSEDSSGVLWTVLMFQAWLGHDAARGAAAPIRRMESG